MATQVIGSIAVNNLLPIQARGAGTANYGPVAIPAGYSIFWVVFDLQQVSSLTAVLSGTADISLDGGANWSTVSGAGIDLSVSGFVVNNGVLTRSASDPAGPGPVRAFAIRILLQHTDSTQRMIRGTVTASEALTSGVTLMAW